MQTTSQCRFSLAIWEEAAIENLAMQISSKSRLNRSSWNCWHERALRSGHLLT